MFPLWVIPFLDSLNIRLEGVYTLGPSYDLKVDAARNLVFLSVAGGVAIYDITDRTSPVLLSDTIRTPGFVVELAYDGDSILFMGDFYQNFEIWNVSDPYHPVKQTSVSTPFPISGLFLYGNYLYVAQTLGGVIIYDISNPSSPSMVGYFSTYPYALDVFVRNDTAYVAADTGGIYIYDVSDPSSPSLIGSFNGGWRTLSVLPSGNYLIVGADSGGVRFLDISDPTNPVEIAYYDTEGRAGRLAISGSYLFVADGPGGVVVLDISNPSTPKLLTTIPNPTGIYVLAAYPVGTELFVCHSAFGLEIYDINSFGPYETGYYTYSSSPLHAALNYPYLYVTTLYGLSVLDVSDPTLPTEVYYLADTISTGTVVLDGSRLYILKKTVNTFDTTISDTAVFLAYDISTPSTPSLIDSFKITYDNHISPQFYVENDTLWLLKDGNVWAYDVSNLSSISYLGYVPVPADAFVKVGDIIFTYRRVYPSGVLYAYSLSSNTLLDTLSVPLEPGGMVYQSGYLYLGTSSWPVPRVLTVSASDPSNLAISDIDTLYGLSSLSLAKLPLVVLPSLLLGVSGDKFVFLDISIPSNPIYLGYEDLPGGIYRGFTAQGNYAYLPLSIGWVSRLSIWDISSTSEPTLIGSEHYLTLSDNYHAVFYAGRLITGDYVGAFNIYDVSIPSYPTLRNRSFLPDSLAPVRSFAVSGSYLYTFTPRLSVLSLAVPDSPALLGVCDSSAPSAYMEAVGNYVFAPYYHSFISYDISDPSAPAVAAVITETSSVYLQDLEVMGDTAYVLSVAPQDSLSHFSIRKYDISNPYAPVRLDSTPVSNSFVPRGRYLLSSGVAYMYIREFPGVGKVYLATLDVSSGMLLDTLYVDSLSDIFAYWMVKEGNFLFVADGRGIKVFDISDPSNLSLVAYRYTPTPAKGVEVSLPYVYAILGGGGLHVYRLASTRISEAGDKKENGIYTVKGGVEVVIEKTQRIKIYDISGRLRFSKTLKAGKHKIHLMKGVYFVKTGSKIIKVVVP